MKLESYSIGKREFCSYEIPGGVQRRRLVLFRAGPKFYECETQVLKEGPLQVDAPTLFRIQQSVLSSLTF